MRRHPWGRLAGLLPLLPLLAFRPALASDLARDVVSTGSLQAAGGSHRLGATVGESGPVGRTAGGSFTLGLGFWGPVLGLRATTAPAPPVGPSALMNFLGRNQPNPFLGSTSIPFALAQPAPVRFEIFDVTGRRVATLAEGDYAPGRYAATWTGRDANGRPVASGIYFYRIHAGSWSDTRRMLKLR